VNIFNQIWFCLDLKNCLGALMYLKLITLSGLITVFGTFSVALHAQSMSDVYKAQETERAKLEEQKVRSADREVRRREFRKSIDEGASVDILKCSFMNIAFGFENEVLMSDNSGKFYFGPTTTGVNHRDLQKSSNGIWQWGSGEFEYDSKQMKLFMKEDRSAKVNMYECKIFRKKASGSIL